jgi:aldehyde dehydrogenase (NAD+)
MDLYSSEWLLLMVGWVILGSFINGEIVKREDTPRIKILNPADTREEISIFSGASLDDVKRAIDSAYEAFNKWSGVPPHERSKILFRAANIIEQELEDFAKLLTREEGKTLRESKVEVERAIGILRFYAGIAPKVGGKTLPSQFPNTMVLTVREPLGVISVITPWNFPIAIPAWKIAPALITGNTVVFKPSSLTPTIAMKFVDALYRAGLPKGVLNMVVGSGSSIGDELIVNKKISAVSFTGSTEVGLNIHRKAGDLDRFLRIQLELGGKNALVVAEDADLGEAVDIAVRGGFGLTGQACSATSRVLVHSSKYDAFVRALSERASKIRVGNGLRDDVDMGPLVSLDAKRKVKRYIDIGISEGAKLVYGGSPLEEDEYRYGYFFQPTVFAECTKDMRIFREEIFGPVICVTPYRSLDEAIELTNSVDYGLVAGIVSRDMSKIIRFIEKAEAGVIRVNMPTVGMEYQVPYGGFKLSGNDLHKEQGEEAIDFYTRVKAAYIRY